jgi:hypothetical protein
MKQVSKSLLNLKMHDLLTILEVFLLLVICKQFTPMNSLKSAKWKAFMKPLIFIMLPMVCINGVQETRKDEFINKQSPPYTVLEGR